MAYRPLKMGNSNGTRFDNYGYYTITPRWERRHFGIYIPYTFVDENNVTSYKENMLGATIRVGSVFVGSSNLGTMAFNKNLKAADVHAGFKVGITYGKPTLQVGTASLHKKNAADTISGNAATAEKTALPFDSAQSFSAASFNASRPGNIVPVAIDTVGNIRRQLSLVKLPYAPLTITS